MHTTLHFLKCAKHADMFSTERAFEDYDEIVRFMSSYTNLHIEDLVVQIPDSIKDEIIVKICFEEQERQLKRTLSQNCDNLTTALSKVISGKCCFEAQFRGEIKAGAGCC